MLSAAQRRQDAPESLPDRREKMNQTRMDQRRAQWKPGPETYICNFHYDGLKGPIRADLPSYPPYSNDLTTSILSASKETASTSGSFSGQS